MEKEKSLLSPDERIMNDITATFEVTENMGIIYKFGNLVATNKKLILYTKYPLLELREAAIYHYEDVTQVDTANALFSFSNGVSFAVKLANKGNTKLLLEFIKLFSNHTLRTRDL
ncbi:hypothetical protein GCM10028778_22290 [Barrientosiimonas marina]|uniref:PH domain-containing protein n=1 Tax=Lentibacillus kimchii TaxID=1542911 RepID=A0ABW2UTH3_9BACI